MNKVLNNLLQIFSIFGIIGSLLLVLIMAVAYIDLVFGGMGWIVALFGFIFGLTLVVGFIVSMILFFASLSNPEPIGLLKSRWQYWFIPIFLLILGFFVKVMQITGNS
jgi:hypothetical protein